MWYICAAGVKADICLILLKAFIVSNQNLAIILLQAVTSLYGIIVNTINTGNYKHLVI